MPIPLKFYETMPDNPQPGDYWPDTGAFEGMESENYRRAPKQRDGTTRPMLVFEMPARDGGSNMFCPDADYDGETWTVAIDGDYRDGRISVSPSIHSPRRYHGYIRNGEMTDDLND